MSEDTLTVLGHTDLISEFGGDLRYLTVPQPKAQITMAGLKSLRPLVVWASLCPYHYQDGSDRPYSPGETWQQWLHFRETIEASPSFRLLLPSETIDPDETERIQLLLHLEGAHPLETPAALEQFVAFGGRAVALTWNTANHYAGGAMSDSHLTELGKELLGEMERLGVMLDISHLNEASFWQVLEVYRGPIFASHSNARELADSPRNLTKRQLHALRERASWVGVSFARSHLTTHSRSTMDDVLLHLEALREDVGMAGVGLGTDFGGILSDLPTGLETVGDLAQLWPALEKNGWSATELVAIRGQNFVDFLGRSMKPLVSSS